MRTGEGLTKCRAIGGISVISGFLIFTMDELKVKHKREGFRFIWELGLGKMSRLTLITGWVLPTSGDEAVIPAVLMANVPQTLFSMLYLIINNLFTSLSLAKEWSRYGARRTPLRVSKPRGEQRSTYFLQIPYRHAIPFTAFSTFLHWSMSQAIFFSQVDARDPIGAPSKSAETDGRISCSYSPLGMILTAIAIFALMVFAISLGLRKVQSGIPLAGSSSAAISAACHSPEGPSELLAVIWGAIPDMKEYTEDGKPVGHCAFSNGPVNQPIEGCLYA